MASLFALDSFEQNKESSPEEIGDSRMYDFLMDLERIKSLIEMLSLDSFRVMFSLQLRAVNGTL